jgi:hypothetical protein
MRPIRDLILMVALGLGLRHAERGHLAGRSD